jgi:hypothetical protein
MNKEGNQLISISTLELFGRSLGSSNYLALSRSIAIMGKPRRSDPAAFPVQQPYTRSKSRACNTLSHFSSLSLSLSLSENNRFESHLSLIFSITRKSKPKFDSL